MVTQCDAYLYKGVMARCWTHRRVQHDKRTPAAVQTVLFYMVSKVLPSHTVFRMKVSQTVCVCVCECVCGNGIKRCYAFIKPYYCLNKDQRFQVILCNSTFH